MPDRPPGAPAVRLSVQSYAGGVFRIGGQSCSGTVLLFPDRLLPLDVKSPSALVAADLAPVFDRSDPPVRILLVGCGERIAPLAPAAAAALRAAGIAVELMDTGAACRTFNVLAGEGRAVAALLLPVGARDG